MHKIVIADTSCLIVLTKINELDLLNLLYKNIVTTKEVAKEFDEPLPTWITLNEISDKHVQQLLELQVDAGEASAIAFALETDDCTIILDDFKARKLAKKLGLKITGTIGIVVKAKQKGVIPSIKPYLEKIRNANFYLSAEIELQALKLAKEVNY